MKQINIWHLFLVILADWRFQLFTAGLELWPWFWSFVK